MTSAELIPLSDARPAYNVLYGTELQTHTDALTAEQAERINEHYDIEVFVGTHGLIPDGESDDTAASKVAEMDVPTQKE